MFGKYTYFISYDNFTSDTFTFLYIEINYGNRYKNKHSNISFVILLA